MLQLGREQYPYNPTLRATAIRLSIGSARLEILMSTLELLLKRFDNALMVRPVVAGQVLAMAKPTVYNSLCQGNFPVSTVDTRMGRMVRTTDLAHYIDSLTPIPPKQKSTKGRIGAPTKAERVEAQRRGITVRELRAQRNLVGA